MDHEERASASKQQKAKRRKLAHPQDSQLKDSTETTTNITGRLHSAGADAFATAYVFATFLSKSPQNEQIPISFQNKAYLVGKDFPLLIAKSQFGNT